jgi:hypothetical protein
VEGRTLEVHYGAFVLSQSRPGAQEAERLALSVRYGPTAREAQVAGHAARVYELGPEPEPGDIDGRSPAVVTWHDAAMFYLIASGEMSSNNLVKIATSLYKRNAATMSLLPTGLGPARSMDETKAPETVGRYVVGYGLRMVPQ